MAINTLEYAKIFQTALDKQMAIEATSGWMEANAGQVQYNGGNEVKVPMISTDGLGKYDRDTGFPQGSVTYKYETLKMTQDRGRTFHLDSMDVNETNFGASAGAVMGEFQRLQVVPEVDAYRYSTIYSLASAAGSDHITSGYTAAASSILSKLDDEITAMQDVIGDTEPLVIVMNRKVRTILNNASNISRYLSVADFKSGAVNTKVQTYNDIPIIGVPSARMMTAYTFNDGTTEGQTAGGFTAAADAVQINWILIARKAPIAVSKTEKIRIFAPDTNQAADAWKLDFRKYHDLWILENKLAGVHVNVAGA